ncbi:MAG: M4 family metallopeptidase [Kiritimatiellae bacterium]|nr:M4 family metallopeptidase [Kiritimatiellia bacterium]
MPVLAYELKLFCDDAVPGRWRYWVNANDGSIVNRYNDVQKESSADISGSLNTGEGGAPVNITGVNSSGYYWLRYPAWHWEIYDYPNSRVARNDTATWGTSTSARSEISAANNFNLIQTYYSTVHNRNSYDNSGAKALVNVHYHPDDTAYDNGFWDSYAQAFFFFPGKDFGELTVLDVCAHEFTHAVTAYSANLTYQNESGALNESFSDIFGTVIEFACQPDGRGSYPDRTAGCADWLCGEDSTYPVMTAGRDLRDPQRCGQPSKYHGTYWYDGTEDNGGVHVNDGVQNHFFYLLCEGGSGVNDGISYNINGIGVSNAAQVAYRTLTVYCGQDTDHAAARAAWCSAANDLNSAWASSVSQAWDAVGVGTNIPSTNSYPEITSPALGQAVNASQLTWKTWGTTGSYWFTQTATTHDGTNAAQSGPIGNGEQSYIKTTVTGPGTLSFYWKTSYDHSDTNSYLLFTLDGIPTDGFAGDSPWLSKNYAISNGTHACQWTYYQNTSAASNACWLDQVVWTPETINHAPATPALTSPANGANAVSITPTLQASAFSDQDGDSHANSQWQVDNASSFASPEWDSGESYTAGTQATVPDNKLAHDIIYYWRGRYKDSQGTWSEWSLAYSFTTIQETINPPSAPSGVTADNGGQSDKILIYWDSVSTATGYKIWRGIDDNAQNASVLGTSTVSFYLDTSAVPGVIYYYWVQATNSAGESSLSYPGSGHCGSIDPILTIPTGVNASDGIYADYIKVAWQAVSGATKYEVWRSTENDFSLAALIREITGTSYNDASVSQGIYYYYWVRAKNANGYGSYSASDSGWRRLITPAGVNASDGLYSYRIRVAWNAVENAAWYEIWRKEIPGGNYNGGNLTKVAQVSATYFNDYYTKSGVYYQYKVKAGNGLGSSLDYGHDTGYRQVNATPKSLFAARDYDGDKLTDLALFNPASGVFDVLCSGLGRQTFSITAQDGQAISGDLDGDRLTDPLIYCPGSGIWLARLSRLGYNPIIQASFGGNGEDAVSADFDGDELADLVIYNETEGVLSAILSNYGAFDIRASCLMGGPGYSFVSADFDGDGKADPTVYSESEGRAKVIFSGNKYSSESMLFGGPGQTMFAADFDGDLKADPVLYEQATGIWMVFLSKIGYREAGISFGGPGHVPAIGDYDGDSKADPAIYQPGAGLWRIMLSDSGYSIITETFGSSEYQPIAR